MRRAWLADFAKRKTAPKGTAAFLAVALSLDTHALTSGGNELAAGWLGKKHPGFGHADLSPAKSTTENRALVIALVQVLAAYKVQMTKGTWRADGTQNAAGRYLRFQQRSGYTLAEVEQYAISNKTA